MDVARVEAGPDPDRGRVLQLAPRDRAGAALLPVRARPRPAGRPAEGVAVQRQARAAGRAGGRRPDPPPRRAWSSSGPGSKGCSPSTTWRRPSRRSCIATRCPSTRRASRSAAPRASPGARRSRRWSAFGSVDKRFERARHAPVGRVERRGRARQGRRHRRPDAVPRPRAQTHANSDLPPPVDRGPLTESTGREIRNSPFVDPLRAARRRRRVRRGRAREHAARPGGRRSSACAIGLAMLAWRTRRAPTADPPDPGRRRFLTLAGLGGFAWLLRRRCARPGHALADAPRPDARSRTRWRATWAPSTWSSSVAPTTRAGRVSCSSCWRRTTARTTRRSRATW